MPLQRFVSKWTPSAVKANLSHEVVVSRRQTSLKNLAAVLVGETTAIPRLPSVK
jgi:hypothetical protein